MRRVLLDPQTIARQKRTVQETLARILQEKRFDNFHQLQNHLLAKGYRIDGRDLEALSKSEHSLTVRVHTMLWEALAPPELDPLMFGPTIDEPALYEHQLKVLRNVMTAYMQAQGITTQGQLRVKTNFSGSTCTVLFSGDALPSWETFAKLRRLVNDDRLQPDTFERISVEELLADRTKTTADQRKGAPGPKKSVKLTGARAAALQSAIQTYMDHHGITSLSSFSRRVGISGSSNSNLLRDIVTGKVVERIHEATGDDRLAPERFWGSEGGSDAPPAPPERGRGSTKPPTDSEPASITALKSFGFLLTAETFRPVEFAPTNEQLRDTEALLRELYRRLALLAMVRDDAVRQRIRAQFGPLIDEFYLALRIFEHTHPTAIVRLMDEQRQSFASIHDLVREDERKEGSE